MQVKSGHAAIHSVRPARSVRLLASPRRAGTHTYLVLHALDSRHGARVVAAHSLRKRCRCAKRAARLLSSPQGGESRRGTFSPRNVVCPAYFGIGTVHRFTNRLDRQLTPPDLPDPPHRSVQTVSERSVAVCPV